MSYADNVFINCPFDVQFDPLKNAIIFSIFDCGFVPRCALELGNGNNVRFENIKKLIYECRFGIHDISRTELDDINNLPRFNMPLELGVFIGAAKYGGKNQKSKSILILDTEQHRYQKFISDIAGQDIRAHGGQEATVIKHVRNWLASESKRKNMPGGEHIGGRYAQFKVDLPEICRKALITSVDLPYNDYANFVSEWVAASPLAQAAA
jgi:hypothetical protein